MSEKSLSICFLVFTLSLVTHSSVVQADVVLSAEEYELGQLINQYRAGNGLASIPVTVSLTDVAQKHVNDLHVYEPDSDSNCTMHSWSANGIWSPVCYTANHANAQGMWDKPREITNNLYSGNGYEIAFNAGLGQASGVVALTAWQNSPAHNDVILNQGIWNGLNFNPWPAMGIGIFEHHAVVWFGETTDPQGNANSVPEPSAMLIFSTGFAAFIFRHRRRPPIKN